MAPADSDSTTRPSPDSQPTRPAGPAPDPGTGRSGKFVPLERLGKGGMGEVWKALDTELNRHVALKYLLGDDADEIARFEREARIAGRLAHPNIAAIHEVGVANGRHFIAMQFVPGVTLRVAPRANRRELVRLLRDVALAIQYAHERGVVHRDLKPENLMVEAGRVYVMDFGLARQVQAAHSLSGMAVGTPSYMPPEQARGSRADERSDVYGLGATLYELLTDRPPFEGADVYSLLIDVIETEPRRPRLVNPSLDADIETIVLKCLEKDPARRYPTAKALADDLTRWLAQEPIEAHPPSVFYRWRKRILKRRGVVVAGTAGLLLAVLVAVVTIPRWLEARGNLAALKELGVLWTDILLAKQELYRPAAQPAKVREKLAAAVGRMDAHLETWPRAPQGWYVRARGRLYLDDLDGARADLEEALRIEPRFAPAEALLGRVLLEMYTQRLYGNPRTVASRIAMANPLLAAAKEHLARGAGGSAASWGLARTREDDVAERVTAAMMLTLVENQREEGIRRLQEAHAQERSEEYANWIGLWSKEWSEMVRFQTESLELMPHYAKARLDRGTAYAFARKFPDAVADFEKAVEISPRNAAARYMLAVTLYRLAAYDRAIEQCTAALALTPRAIDVLLTRAMCRRHAGDLAGSLADAEAALALEDGNLTALMERARTRAQGKDFDAALRDSDRAVEIDPKSAWAWETRATVRGLRGDLEGELQDLLQALALDPECAPAWLNRSAVDLKRGAWKDAVQHAGKALELDPFSVEAYVNRANARGRLGDTAGAEEDVAKALAINPRKSEALSTRAVLRGQKGDLDGAIEDARRAIELDATNASAWGVRGAARSRRGDPGAIEDFTRAVDLDPSAENYAGRAGERTRLKQYREALLDASKAVELDDRLARAWFQRGLAKEKQSDLRGALGDWNRAVDLDPNYAVALHNRGNVREQLGDYDGAMRDQTRAVECNPGYAEAYYNRALLHARRRDLQAAVDDTTKAIECNPGYAEAWANRAGFQRALGRKAEAIADFEKALEVAPPGWSYRGKVESLLKALRDER